MSATIALAKLWYRGQRRRNMLVILAIGLAISMVLFTIASYRAVTQRSTLFAQDLLGRWDLVVMPTIALRPTIAPELIDELRRDPRVEEIVATDSILVEIEDAADTTYYDSWPAAGIATVDGRAPADLREGRWPEDATDVIEGVLSGGFAHRWRVAVNDRMPIHGPGGEFTLLVVGITDERLSHPDASGVFVAPETLRRLAGTMRTSSRLYVDLAAEVAAPALVSDWAVRFAAADPPVQARDLTGFAAELRLDSTVKRLRLLGGVASAVALLAALFIVATAMAAGADARMPHLALLRTIGATRAQVTATILIEAAMLTSLGAVVGVPLGVAWLTVLGLARADLFGGAMLPGVASIVLALGIGYAGALLAALRPALRAGRTTPLAAVRASAPQVRPLRVVLRAGLALTVGVVAAVMLTVPGLSERIGLMPATLIVLGCLAAIVPLAMPLLLAAVGRQVGPALGRLLGLPGELLRLHRITVLRRATGIAMTLTVCLGSSVLLNTWGRTMVTPFLPSPQLPDQVISLLPAGVPPEHADAIREVPGIVAERVVPLRVEQTFLGTALIAHTAGDLEDISVQIIGIDPAVLTAGGANPLLHVEANLPMAELAELLAQPDACLVPPAFAQTFALAPGDTMPISHCSGQREVALRVSGIASLPGWQWITKMGRMRTLSDKPMAAILVSMATAERLGVPTIRHWLADTADDADPAILRRHLQKIADTHAGAYRNAHFGPAQVDKPSVKMIATGEIARRMQERSDAVIWVLGAIPLATLLIAVLGVAHGVTAGIRARQWEFAVLRAVGMTGLQVRRMILGETLVTVVAAVVMSFIVGIAMAWAAITVSLQLFATGTGAPPLIIPWLDIVLAAGITAAAALAAAALPARRLGQRTPIALLAEGRMAG